MLGSIGTVEIIVIILIMLLLFGNRQLSQIIRVIVKWFSDLKKSSEKISDEIKNIMDDDNFVG